MYKLKGGLPYNTDCFIYRQGTIQASYAVMRQLLLYLQLMMTCMRARKSSNFGLIGPLTAELAAPEHLKKNPHRLIMGKMMSPIFSSVLNRILFMLAGDDNIHQSLDEFEIQSNLIRDHRVSCF